MRQVACSAVHSGYLDISKSDQLRLVSEAEKEKLKERTK